MELLIAYSKNISNPIPIPGMEPASFRYGQRVVSHYPTFQSREPLPPLPPPSSSGWGGSMSRQHTGLRARETLGAGPMFSPRLQPSRLRDIHVCFSDAASTIVRWLGRLASLSRQHQERPDVSSSFCNHDTIYQTP